MSTGFTCWLRTWSRGVAIAAAVAVGAPATTAAAQSSPDDLPSKSYITPFPQGDIYRVRVFGDSWADGLLPSIKQVSGEDARMRIDAKVSKLNAVVTTRWARDVAAIADAPKSDRYNIAIVMVGAYDRQSLRRAGQRRVKLGDPAWSEGYRARIGQLMQAFRKRKVAVYWISQPPAQGGNRSRHAALINELIREAALRYRVKMIDIYESFEAEGGGFAAYGPDVEGKVRRLRWKDGLH
ncbi:MAG: GDSL-type esterase/lipase family protein, partial [Pseudomonadota bacterium]